MAVSRVRTQSWGFVAQSAGSVKQSLRRRVSSSSGADLALECTWQVGGRYKVGSESVIVWVSPGLTGSIAGDLVPHKPVLLVSLLDNNAAEGAVAFVMQSASRVSGWVAMDGSGARTCGSPVVQRRLDSSWEPRARYCIRKHATLRQGTSLSSAEVGDVAPGEEVFSVELAANDSDGTPPRLRMLVATQKGVRGWLSPETPDGAQLLYPVNLLGPKVAEALRSSGTSIFARLISTSEVEPMPGDFHSIVKTRHSYEPGLPLPWAVGGQYRILDQLALRSQPELKAPKKGKLATSILVTVQKLTRVECSSLGWCPCALVTVDEGALEGNTGWVRCSDADGKDLVDVRNQHDLEAAMQRETHSPERPASPTSGIKPALRKRAMTDDGTAPKRTVSFRLHDEEDDAKGKKPSAGIPQCMDCFCALFNPFRGKSG